MTKGAPLALYIHWPFCVSKCPYCDFNSHVRDQIDQAAWCAALLADMAYEAGIAHGRPLTSIFFGGGTPSLMPPATVAALIEAAGQYWGFADGIEITLEANPSSVEAARFADLARAGINRVSLGLQALNNAALNFLGRAHDVDEGLAALETAQANFVRVNFDLIYARPHQSEADWQAELGRAISFGTTHLSLYQLTIEPGTRFATLVDQGKLTPAEADHSALLYELTGAMMHAAGLPAYEVSNHARAGDESRHNLSYWRYDDYLGIGPGAHGRRQGVATLRHKKPENWMRAIARNGCGVHSETLLSPQEQAREALLMGLRLGEGVDLARISQRSGIAPAQLVSQADVARLERHGLLKATGEHLGITPAGMLLLDHILGEIVIV